MKKMGIWLPPSVWDIIKAAGGERDFPRAMAAIVGALPWIAAEVSQRMTSTEYKAFRSGMKLNINAALEVIDCDDPKAAFDALYEQAKRGVN